MVNFCSYFRRTVFLGWKYGRPLDFCLKSLLKLVSLFLFHPKVHTTVSFFFCFFFVNPEAWSMSQHLLEVSLKFGEHFPVSS